MLLNPISMIDTTFTIFSLLLAIYVLNGKTISIEKANWYHCKGIDNEWKTLHFMVKHII